ncbi:acyl-CoA dehydrogenase family member 11-like [Phascolarctos cinereus]|uniref:Acyl-CoA dehydrogenase family member 11-like n=1 Tax=Phascolarctos cinereus TaxID=38626 RepID=A0A6P5L9K7_PHACI|nr:acyl-CoA dehydrogenase family member 11-like [Phascolarctos cinereus]
MLFRQARPPLGWGLRRPQAWGPRRYMQQRSSPQEADIPSARAGLGTFFQGQPSLGNQYSEDALLRGSLKRQLPTQVFAEVNQDLQRFGARVSDEILSLGQECEAKPPRLKQFDGWGQHVDHILTCSAWKKLKGISAEEGLIAIGYERKYSSWSRMYQVAKLFLFSPSSGMFICPLAMTDGAARVLEVMNPSGAAGEAFGHLTSRDPKHFWTSGQWMTERKGGSDVAHGTETVALKQEDGTYKLFGLKWFTSSTDADMTLALARIRDAQGSVTKGTRGLSLFFLKPQDEQGQVNGLEVQRLKEKLGTRQLATAELLLDGARAHLVSQEGRGVATIANMLTITRIYNAVCAVGFMRRVVTMAREYATKRFAFGKFLKDHPLHTHILARMEVQTRGGFLLVMEVGRLLGLKETNLASAQDSHLLRLLASVTKLYTGKQAMAVVSEGLECFGGQGYMEDTSLAGILRDTQVLTIWEGTTNILALDTLYVLAKSQGQVMQAFSASVQEKVASASNHSELAPSIQCLRDALRRLAWQVERLLAQGSTSMEMEARALAYTLARIYIGALLIEHAAWAEASPSDVYASQRWCEQDLCPLDTAQRAGCYGAAAVCRDIALVYEASPTSKGKEGTQAPR